LIVKEIKRNEIACFFNREGERSFTELTVVKGLGLLLKNIFSFLLAQKRTKKGPRQSITARLPVGFLIRHLCYCSFSINKTNYFIL
jgi:hypothetical protein